MVKIYQLFYDHRTQGLLDPISTPIFTGGVVTPLFESYWMNVLPIPEYGYMAVLSPEFTRKTGMTVRAAVKKSKDEAVDVYYPFTIMHRDNTWKQGEVYHPGFLAVAQKVLEGAGLDFILKRPTVPVYSNAFLMKVEYWREFRRDWLRPVIESLQKNDAISSLPCRYQTSSPHSRGQILQATGLPYYTYKPFICERLIGSFIVEKKLTHRIWTRH